MKWSSFKIATIALLLIVILIQVSWVTSDNETSESVNTSVKLTEENSVPITVYQQLTDKMQDYQIEVYHNRIGNMFMGLYRDGVLINTIPFTPKKVGAALYWTIIEDNE